MLVLSRQRGERIWIGASEVRIVDIRGDKVRVGIEAPRVLPVHREEVLRSIHAEDPELLRRLGYELSAGGIVLPVADFS